MTDTVELWTLRDENADLRRQLAEAKQDCERLNQMLRDTGQGQGAIDAYVSQCEQLAEAQRQRDEAQAACAAMREAFEQFAGERHVYHGRNPDAFWNCSYHSCKFAAKLLRESNHGRDLLARLEAAQRTVQAADGLAKALQHVRLKIGTEAVGRKADLIDFIDAALAAYQATKEQK